MMKVVAKSPEVEEALGPQTLDEVAWQGARAMLRHFRRFTIRHTLRAGNKEADRLANLAVDRADGRWIERRRVDS